MYALLFTEEGAGVCVCIQACTFSEALLQPFFNPVASAGCQQIF